MNPQRRSALAALTSLALVIAATPLRAADKVPREGTEYRLVSPPQSADDRARVEVIEFFSYACPHCFSFEPLIMSWSKQLPADVVLRRVPVLFRPDWIPVAMLYYTLEVLDELGRMHQVVFNAIHKEKQNLSTPAGVADFMERNGVPRNKFTETYSSFAVQTRTQRSGKLQSAYKVDEVPMMAVDGLFVTSNSMVGGAHEAVFPVLDYLIGEARKRRKLSKT